MRCYKYTIGLIFEILVICVFIVIGRKIIGWRVKIANTEIDIISKGYDNYIYVTEVKFRINKNNALQAWRHKQAHKLMKVAQNFNPNVSIEYIACWFIGYKRFIINPYDISNSKNSNIF